MREISEQMIARINAGEAVQRLCAESMAGGLEKKSFYRQIVELIERGLIGNALRCFCGNDCGRCLVFRGTIYDDEEMRKKAARAYREDFGWDYSADELYCYGARDGEVFSLCRDCPWMACCKEKRIDACDQCECYPCARLSGYIERYVNKVNII